LVVNLGYRPSSLLGEEFLSAPILSPLYGRLIGPSMGKAIVRIVPASGEKSAFGGRDRTGRFKSVRPVWKLARPVWDVRTEKPVRPVP
jgi:hypothetical protein